MASNPGGSLPHEPQQRVRTCVRLLTDPGLRLLTLTGAPGVGKSWLARQVALTVSPRPPVVELGEVDNWLLFLPALAEQLGVTADPPTLWAFKQAITHHLRDKPTLLVLDGFDGLMPAAATVAELLETCPGLTLLVTSRLPLRLAGEQACRVPSLSVPDLSAPATFGANSSVRLLLEHTQVPAPVSAGELAQLAELCVRLDGLPLALLAAARQLPPRSPEDLLADLDDPAYLKSWSLGEVEPSRETWLYDLLEWRYTRLPEDERRLLEGASMFEAPFEVSALSEVVSAYEAGVQVTSEQVEGLAARGFFDARPAEEGGTDAFILGYLTQDFLTLKLSNTDRYTRLVEAYESYLAGVSATSEEATYTAKESVTDVPKPSTPNDVGRLTDPFEDPFEQDRETLELLTEELTERELDVLQLVARGLSNREVANRLDISHRTVSTHLSNIYGKLGVRTRTAAALRAHQLELVPNP